jgi:putative membrane-bound dehydrogenase-like protein
MIKRSLAVALLLAGCAGPTVRPAGYYRVGAARVDITPKEPIRLSGYASRTAPSEGVEQPLYARAVAFEDARGQRAVVVAADAIAVSWALTEEIAGRVSAETGLPRDRIAVAASHSHTAPALSGVIPNILELGDADRDAVARYTRTFVQGLSKAASAALADLSPATLSLGAGHAGFGANRRTPGGPVDPEVPVLRAVHPDGRPKAVLFGYACHCTTLQFNRVTGDWAGYASEELEEEYPDLVAAALIGCGADQNPNPRGTLPLAKSHGRALAKEVSRVLQSDHFRPIRGSIGGSLARIGLPFEALPTPEQLRETAEKHARPEERRRAKLLLDRIAKEGALSPVLPYPVQSVAFGDDLCLVFLGGEVVVDYALRLKREYDPARIWPVAYANDVPGYIPSVRILEEGGYEGGGAMVWYGQPARFAKEVEETIHAAVRSLVPPSLRRPEPAPVRGPAGPEESLALLEVEPGFEVDLAAAEPLVRDPIHVSWDARGRMYVTEMIDYPEGPPAGRVMRLEDADGDGRCERGTVFASGLPFPTSATPWRDGVLVTCDPDLLYLEDKDGDGLAEVKRVLFTGFAGGNTQHRVNSLQWGIDNWIYGGNGDSSATVRSVEFPARPPATMTFADFRFRPDTGEFEALAEHSGYALAFDDAGNRFVSQSGGNVRHVVLDRKLRDRNPLVPSVQGAQALESRVRLHPRAAPVERFNDPLDVGFFTAASGLAVYRGGLFPEHYRGNLFIGDSAGNLVHRDVPVRQGATMRAAPHSQPREFLASGDPWFRPVFLATGPDGCLYVCDMYRAVIEHPEWIPNDIEKTLDLRAGDDRGRIYRVRHRSAPPPKIESLHGKLSTELVARLESPNGWVRDTAQRLLFERQDAGAAPDLARMAAGSASPVARLHALWLLQGLGALDPALLASRLADPDARVRESALRLAGAVETAALLPLLKDPEPAVRLRLAAALGDRDDPAVVAALGDLVFDPASDEWIRSAALLSKPEIAHRVLARVAERAGTDPKEGTRMLPSVWRLSTVAGARNDPAQLKETLDLVLPSPGGAMAEWQMVALGGGLVGGLARRFRTPGARLRELAPPDRFARAVEAAGLSAEDAKLADGTRYDALRVLGADGSPGSVAILRKYLSPKLSPELQQGAIAAVSDLDLAGPAAELLLEPWASQAPAERQAVLEAVFRRADRVPALLDALEKKRVSVLELGDNRREQLRRLADEAARVRALAVLETDVRADRKQVLEGRKGALALAGRRAEGLALFAKHCAACHPVQGVGPQVGPDLVRVRKREKAGLYQDILDPDASVAPNFVAYQATTRDEVIHAGIVVSQSAQAVTLRLQGGAEKALPRAEIEELKSTGKSFMPAMFETVLSDQELADLIEYLRQIQ